MRDWELSIGLYPGVLFGVRTYDGEDGSRAHVFYLPFIDICLRIINEEDE